MASSSSILQIFPHPTDNKHSSHEVLRSYDALLLQGCLLLVLLTIIYGTEIAITVIATWAIINILVNFESYSHQLPSMKSPFARIDGSNTIALSVQRAEPTERQPPEPSHFRLTTTRSDAAKQFSDPETLIDEDPPVVETNSIVKPHRRLDDALKTKEQDGPAPKRQDYKLRQVDKPKPPFATQGFVRQGSRIEQLTLRLAESENATRNRSDVRKQQFGPNLVPTG
ncbi:hypothetical protein BC938DRAFT_479018 [Jimgerdemannia flammicorona]|uniref:Uncharacterized protein n=1 Tax=Jimgerdemannia flammicorona TaxID=994334 RepID=A0A433QLT9_9FUNG|nr:hypothetical protein BC938DRAFT_479018 [Jimgerdemannia flammicorona]